MCDPTVVARTCTLKKTVNREENVALGIGPSGVRGSKELLTLEAFTFTISSAQLTFTNYNYKLMIKRKWPKNKEPFKILKKI